MIYVVDSNILRSLLFHFPKKGKIYELVWSSLDAGIKAKRIISVDECFNELKRQFSKDTYALNWINAHLGMFQKPDDKESIIIRDLFMDRKMRESIHEKNITMNSRKVPVTGGPGFEAGAIEKYISNIKKQVHFAPAKKCRNPLYFYDDIFYNYSVSELCSNIKMYKSQKTERITPCYLPLSEALQKQTLRWLRVAFAHVSVS